MKTKHSLRTTRVSCTNHKCEQQNNSMHCVNVLTMSKAHATHQSMSFRQHYKQQ